MSTTTSKGTEDKGRETPGLGYLCLAWGESDHAVTRYVETADEVAGFFCDEWFGDQPINMSADTREEFDAAMARVRADHHDSDSWDGGDVIDWKFEIGGISVTRAFQSGESLSTLRAEREALKAELDDSKRLCFVFKSIAGANLNGTDEADEIAKAHGNPYEAFNEAYRRGRERSDATIEAIAKVVRERAEKAEAELAALKAECERLRSERDDYRQRWTDVSIALRALACQPHAPNDHMTACDRTMGDSHPCTCTANDARVLLGAARPLDTPKCETCGGKRMVSLGWETGADGHPAIEIVDNCPDCRPRETTP